MIIHHQSNVAGLAGNQVFYWFGQPLLARRVSATSSGPVFKVFWAIQSTHVVQPGDWV